MNDDDINRVDLIGSCGSMNDDTINRVNLIGSCGSMNDDAINRVNLIGSCGSMTDDTIDRVNLIGSCGSINDDAINRLPRVECNALITSHETVEANKQLSSCKALGSDAVIYKATCPLVADNITVVTLYMMLRDASMKPLSISTNGKEIFVYNNHRGISLLSVAGKILARILLNR